LWETRSVFQGAVDAIWAPTAPAASIAVNESAASSGVPLSDPRLERPAETSRPGEEDRV